MIERNYFVSKSSFAVFIWLAITSSAIINSGSIDFNKAYQETEVAVVHALDSAIKLLTPITDTVRSIPLLKDAIPEPKQAVKMSELQCMSENIYHEAGNQSYVGKIAVGQVVLNRTKQQGFPSTVCGVIFEGSQNIHTLDCQFSWTCGKHNAINKNSTNWEQSVKAAKELLSKRDSIIDITEGALNYHADYVKPAWAKKLKFVAQIDQHIFYSR